MSDLPPRLRAYNATDYDTSGGITRDGAEIARVTLIREASELAGVLHEAADEIEHLRAILGRRLDIEGQTGGDVCDLIEDTEEALGRG